MKQMLTYKFTTDYSTHRNDMQSLWKRVYGHPNEKLFDTFYTNNPLGAPFLGLCYDGDRLVGQENYISQNVAYSGVLYHGAMGIDTLVDPEYRLFHGIFGKLCTLTIEELSNRSDLLFANANEDSKKYYLKYFNWKITEKISIYKKITNFSDFNIESILNFIRPVNPHSDFLLSTVVNFPSNLIDPLIENYRLKSKSAFFHKTASFLNWKFLNNKHYRTKGYILYLKDKACGYCITYDTENEKRILDILVEDENPEIFLKTISTLSTIAKEQGITRLVIHSTDTAWYKPILKKLLFIKRMEYDFITNIFNNHLPQTGWVVHCGDFDFF